MAVKIKTIPKPDAYDVITFFMERGETIDEIVAAIAFYDHNGKQADAAHVRGWYEEAKRLHDAEDKQ